MGLSKSVKALLSVAVSGSFALILHGSALAADSAVGQSPEIIAQRPVAQLKTLPSPATDSNMGGVQVSVENTTRSTDKQGVSTSVQPVNGGPGPTSSTKTVETPLAAATETTDVTTPAGGSDQVGFPTTGAKPDELAPKPANVTPKNTDAMNSPKTAIMLSASGATSMENSKTVTAPETVVLGNQILAVQPRITPARAVIVEDLATLIPSAPVSGHDASRVPVPSQPSGALGRLSAGLAGTVVPSVFHTSASAPVNFMPGLPVVILMVIYLSLGRIVLNFGSWMRRDGYAHAARSDGTILPLFSLFATPLKLSYGAAIPSHHSLFLMVSDNKTLFSMVPNAFRKEEMR